MNLRRLGRLPAMLPLLLLAQSSAASLSMPGVFSDHMVVQRDRPMVFFGSAPAGDSITVQAGAVRRSARADSDGHWQLELPAPPVGPAFTVAVRSGHQRLQFRDVVAGEVWLVSGQSNMEWPLAFLLDAKPDIAGAANPQLRVLTVNKTRSLDPADSEPDRWQLASPDSVAMFSAIGYYYGQGLQNALQVPVGIISAAWGGSRIEPWIPRADWLTAQGKKTLQVTDMAGGLTWLGTMYNGMIAPLNPYPVRGVLWYQGESNVGDGKRYLPKLQTLIHAWRQARQDPQLPFYFAQLAPFPEALGGVGLPLLWEVQTDALKSIADTELVATQDLNPELVIHPQRKREVAQRFLAVALARQYGRASQYRSPQFRSLKIVGSALKVDFDDADGLQVRNDGVALGFEVAGQDGVFQQASAQIADNVAVVSSPEVEHPVMLRYAWDFEVAAIANVVNGAGLPLLPFRSDRNF